MKRYSIIRLFCVLVTLSWCMISCDGFLKESPRDALPEEEGYRNITELYLNAVASLYNYIGGNSDSQGLQGTGRGIYDLNTLQPMKPLCLLVVVTGTTVVSGKDYFAQMGNK